MINCLPSRCLRALMPVLLAAVLPMAVMPALAATPQEAMTGALSAWVAAQNQVDAAQVRVGPLDPRVPVQPCATAFQFDYPFVSRDSVRVRCSRPVWQMYVKVGFHTPADVPAPAPAAPPAARQAATAPVPESRQVVVAGQNLAPGQLLQPEMLKLAPLEADKINRAHLLELSGLEGHEVLRAIRAGDPVRTSDIRPATLVKKGELVSMVVGTPGSFQITVKLEAMQDGRLGEQIKMRNPESGRTLTGIVTGKGAVRGG